VHWKLRTLFKLAIAAYAIAGAAGVVAAYIWAGKWAPAVAACYVAGLWLIVVLLILFVLPPLRRDWTADNLFRMMLWGAAIAGAATLVVVYFMWRPLVYGATIGYLLCYWLLSALYLSHEAPPAEWMGALKALSTGIVFAALAVSVAYYFSPALALVAALALFAIGVLVGMLITFPGASFVMGLGMFSLLVTGFGYSLGDIFGSKGIFVAGAFAVSLLFGLALPPIRNFQKALLATLVTVSAGIAGVLFGTAFGVPLAGALLFLSLGAFLSMTVREERAISLALFSVLSSLMMTLGFAAAFCTRPLYAGPAVSLTGAWVGMLFIESVLIYVFYRAPVVRLALLLHAPVAILVGLGFVIGNPFGLALWTMPVMFALALLFDLWFYFAADSRVLAQNDAWVVSEQDCPRPYAITRRLAASAGLPAPRVALIGSDTPNLFTVGRSPSRAVIAVTQGLLDGLDDDELEAVLAHELSHVRERDLAAMTMAAALASPVGAGARSLVFDEERGANLLMLAAVGIAAPFFALLVQLSNPRSREKLADAAAVRMIKKGEALAGALEKLEVGAGQSPLVANPATGPLFAVNPFRAGWLAALFATHPTTEERVAVLRKAPPAGG
jgi:heat shock protein HtpX